MPDSRSSPRPRLPAGDVLPLFGPKGTALCVVATALGLTVIFWSRLWQGGGLLGGDVYAYNLPQKAFYAECLRAGTLPFWNPRIGNGYPQLAESQTGALYPPNLALYRLLDLNTAYNASVLGHYCLAFVGCWLLARRLRFGSPAAGFAALVYTYGWFPPRISLEWPIVGGAWLPLAMWCVESFVQQRRRRWIVALTAILALQLLAGHFLIAFLTQLLIVVYVPLRLGFGGDDLPDATRGGRGATCLALGLAIAGAYFLAAAQLVPTWELKRLSQRSGISGEHDPGYGAVPVAYLSQVVLPWKWYPDAESFRALHDPQDKRPNRVDAHLYFGMLPLALIAVSVWRARRDGTRVLLVWLGIGVAAILYMPGWFLPITRHLPGFSYFEGPGRFGIVATLAAGLLAGAGFQVVMRWIKPFARPLLIAALFGITTLDLLWVSDLVHDAEVLEKPPINSLADSTVAREIVAGAQEPPRIFSEGHNIPSLIGAGTLPVYLGLAPGAYYDPQLAMPKPYPFRDVSATPAQLDWLQRMGVTHVLSLTSIDGDVWPVQSFWTGADPCLNAPLGMFSRHFLLLYGLAGSRGRVAWLDSESGPRPQVVAYAPQRVEIAAESELGGTLVLTDLDYSGWDLEVDGHAARAVVVDGMLRGVDLAPGRHTVVWTYRPTSFYRGAVISGVALVVLIGLLACELRRKRRVAG